MINSVHMATFLCPQSIQSTWPHSYVYNQFSLHGHTPISTTNSVHMATSYVHDQFSPHGRTPISTINPVHTATLLYLRPTQTTWPHCYVHNQFSTHYPHYCTIKVLFFHLHLGFSNATLPGYRHRYTRNILKCRAARLAIRP